MSFNYLNDPSASPVDAVRFLLGDTDKDSFLFHDEELAWALTQDSNEWFAAAMVAETAAASYATKPSSKSIGETSITYGEASGRFHELASRLRTTARMVPVEPWASGWSKAAKESIESNDDREVIVAHKTDVPEQGLVYQESDLS